MVFHRVRLMDCTKLFKCVQTDLLLISLSGLTLTKCTLKLLGPFLLHISVLKRYLIIENFLFPNQCKMQ